MLSFFGGLAALLFGVYDHQHFGPFSARCHSAAGALGQAFNQQLYQNCQLADTAASFTWWLIVAGIVLMLFGLGDVLGLLGFAGLSLMRGRRRGTPSTRPQASDGGAPSQQAQTRNSKAIEGFKGFDW